MKTEHKVIAISFMFGLLVWIFDAVMDYLFFYEETLLELLITDVPPHEVYIRSLVMVFFLIFGIIVSKIITERKQAEVFLKESEAMFKSIFSQAPVGIELYDSKGDLVNANQECLNIFGVGHVEEIKGFKLFEDPNISAETKTQLRNGEPINYESEFDFEIVKKLKLYKTTRSGKCLLHVQITPYEIPDRGNKGFIVHVQEITERKKAMEEIEKLSKFPTENPNPVLRISKDGTLLYHNRASELLLEHWHYKEEKPLQDRWFQFVLEVLEDDDIKTVETEIGDKIISLTFAPIAEKGFVNVYGLDITERKRAEEELKKHREHLEELVKERTTKLEEKTKTLKKSQQSLVFLTEDVNESRAELENVNKKLETSNKDLEAFAYSVSHDLRGPLRAISGFTRILMEDYVEKLDVEGKRLGGIIQQNTKKMGQLIEDLLAFSRMGRASMSFSEIDMKEMANSIYHEATDAEARKRITFTIADLSKAEGDTNMMRQVWMNLISNAIKFSAKRKQAVISVSCQEEENKFTYCIKDNGAGFNMKYKDKLFGVFQRLHSEIEFEGTGVGLALVQRIIHRHGGEVWANGEVDNGAAFYFSLPKNRRI